MLLRLAFFVFLSNFTVIQVFFYKCLVVYLFSVSFLCFLCYKKKMIKTLDLIISKMNYLVKQKKCNAYNETLQ